MEANKKKYWRYRLKGKNHMEALEMFPAHISPRLDKDLRNETPKREMRTIEIILGMLAGLALAIVLMVFLFLSIDNM